MQHELLTRLGAKPSTSEERGLSLLTATDHSIFSPGISTAGFAEIRMVQEHPNRTVIATTIDEEGLAFAQQIIEEVGLTDRITTKLENIVEAVYPEATFDFVYARLILHYLAADELNSALSAIYTALKPGGRIFIVVRSVNNIPDDPNVTFDPETRFTSIPKYDDQGVVIASHTRYFHSPESISSHLERAGFKIDRLEEYDEQLYRDFMREKVSDRVDAVIEVVAHKPT